MMYEITHTTTYQYNQDVALCHNIARLLPRNTDTQTLQKSTLHIVPLPEVMNAYEDFYGNNCLYFAVQEEHISLHVAVQTLVEKKADAFRGAPPVPEKRQGGLGDRIPFPGVLSRH